MCSSISSERMHGQWISEHIATDDRHFDTLTLYTHYDEKNPAPVAGFNAIYRVAQKSKP